MPPHTTTQSNTAQQRVRVPRTPIDRPRWVPLALRLRIARHRGDEADKRTEDVAPHDEPAQVLPHHLLEQISHNLRRELEQLLRHEKVDLAAQLLDLVSSK